VLTIRSRWCRWLFGSCHAARNSRMHCWCSLNWAPRMISPRTNAGPCNARWVSLAPPLKTSWKLIEGARGAAKKSGVARLFVFRICKTVRKDGGGKRSVSLSEARDLLRLVYIESSEKSARRDKRKMSFRPHHGGGGQKKVRKTPIQEAFMLSSPPFEG
jgi:hypothetical protein